MSIVPIPPTDVHAVAVGMNVLVYWKASGIVDQYRVFGYPGNIQVDVSNNKTVATISGLQKDTLYLFGVTSIKQNNISVLSAFSESVTPRQYPEPSMTLTAQSGNQAAALFWQSPLYGNNPPITQYLVTQYPDETTHLLEQAETSYIWNGLVNGKTYFFSVKAVNTTYYANYASLSNSVLPKLVPFPPINVLAAPSSASAILIWDKPEDEGSSPLYQYRVISFPDGLSVITPGTTVAKVYGLKLDTPYYFVVVATNLLGDSIYSVPSNTIICKKTSVPQPPVNVTAVSQNKSVLIEWEAPEDTGGLVLTGFILTKTLYGTSVTESVVLNDPYSTRFIWSQNIVLGQTYTFTIRATNRLGSSDSSLASEPVVVVTVPDPPTNIRIQLYTDKQSVLVEWDASLTLNNPEVSQYTVVSSPGDFSSTVYRDAQGFIKLYTVITGLDPSVAYQFRVKATNSVGDSPFSELSPFSQIIVDYNRPLYKQLKTGGNDPTINRRQLYARIIRGKYNRNQYVNTGGGAAYVS